jgi:3',5'-cyclic AMP phosphodiesterase CpdA
MRRVHLVLFVLYFTLVGTLAQLPGIAQSLSVKGASSTKASIRNFTLPVRDGSLRVAVFGDSGSGNKAQYGLGLVMEEYRQSVGFDLALLTGDNILGKKSPVDIKNKFELPYKSLLDSGVKFYASLGNHDTSIERFYAPFNMDGEEYYRFERDGVSFYALNSNYLDRKQLDWLVDQLEKDKNAWRIAFFHHPPFSSGGMHGSNKEVRAILHPLFVKYGVDAVFSGHDHVYERVKPQDGINYFVVGAAGGVRRGGLRKGSKITAVGFDSDPSFMLLEFVGDEMHFQAISLSRTKVDSGVIRRRD